MNKKIIFQKCNINYIYFLLYIIIYIFIQIIGNYIDIEDYLKENPNKKNNNYFSLSQQILLTYSSNISDLIAIIPYFIHKKLSKKKNVNNNKIESPEMDECKESNKLIYNDSEKSDVKRKKIINNLFCSCRNF